MVIADIVVIISLRRPRLTFRACRLPFIACVEVSGCVFIFAYLPSPGAKIEFCSARVE